MNRHLSMICRAIALASVVLASLQPSIANGQGAQVGPQATQVTITPLTGYTCPGTTLSPAIMTEGFEGVWPTGSWTVTGNPTWDDSNYKPRTGSWSAWAAKGGTNGVNLSSSNYLNNMNARMIFGPFNLTDAVASRLTFYYWNQSESNYDWLYWLASTDATNFYGYRVSGDSTGWQSIAFDLSNVPTLGSALGRNCVWIGFFFTSDSTITYKGPFVDDIVLEKTRWGAIYNPNPVATSGNMSLVDNSDADDATLTSLRLGKGLAGLDGTGYIRGAYADLATGSGDFSQCNTGINRGLAFDSGMKFVYTRSDDKFEEVNAYYHIDSVQRYIQSLGLDFSILNRRIAVHAHCWTEDNSAALIPSFTLIFGDGGVDDAEDGEVVIHEYGHLIQYDKVPDWGQQAEGRAMGEGFGDYLASSFFADRQSATFQTCFGDWDATYASVPYSNPKCWRRLDTNKVYPQDLIGSPHRDGEIWSRALWQIRTALGGTAADRTVLKSHGYLDGQARFGEGADALISADLYYSGNNVATIASIGRQRGIFDAYEWDSNSGLASTITVNGPAQTHGFHSRNDVDWIKFSATQFGSSWRNAYRIRTFGLAANVDTEITIVATNGFTILAQNDNCPDTGDLSSCQVFAAPSTGIFYVYIASHNRDVTSTGANKTYQINISTIALPNSIYLPIVMNQ